MDHYTFGKILDQVSVVLWTKPSSKHLTVPDHQRFFDIAVKFQERWDFRNVICCTNGKDIHTKCLTKAESLFCSRRQFLSMVLQPVADSEIRFVFNLTLYGPCIIL